MLRKYKKIDGKLIRVLPNTYQNINKGNGYECPKCYAIIPTIKMYRTHYKECEYGFQYI